MDRKKELGIIGGLIGLGAVIIVVTVAWAAFSTTLNINGSATVAKSSWNIQFQNLSAIQEGNDNGVTEGVIEGITPTITGSTTIGTYAVTLTKPGDYAIYDFEIANTGTLTIEEIGNMEILK